MMKDEHLQKYKRIHGSSNGKDYQVDLKEDQIHFTLIDKGSHISRECILTSDRLSKLQILANDLKRTDNLMSYFATIQEKGKQSFIEILPNFSILLKIRSSQEQKFSITLQTKQREQSSKVTVDSETLTHMIELIVQEKVSILKHEIEQKLNKENEERQKLSSQAISPPHKKSIIQTIKKITFACMILLISYVIINQSNQSTENDINSLQKQLFILNSTVQTLANQIASIKADQSSIAKQNLTQKFQNYQEQVSKEISKLLESLQQSKQYEQSLNIKLGYVNEQIGQLRMQLSRFHQDHRRPHQHHPHSSDEQHDSDPSKGRRPNRHHF